MPILPPPSPFMHLLLWFDGFPSYSWSHWWHGQNLWWEHWVQGCLFINIIIIVVINIVRYSVFSICTGCHRDLCSWCIITIDFIFKYCLIPDATLITTAPTDVLYNPKEPANFRCVATTDSATKLTYSWLLNGQPMYTGDIVTNTNILFLDLPSFGDNAKNYIGTWTCNATNTHSWDAASARLYTPEPGEKRILLQS